MKGVLQYSNAMLMCWCLQWQLASTRSRPSGVGLLRVRDGARMVVLMWVYARTGAAVETDSGAHICACSSCGCPGGRSQSHTTRRPDACRRGKGGRTGSFLIQSISFHPLSLTQPPAICQSLYGSGCDSLDVWMLLMLHSRASCSVHDPDRAYFKAVGPLMVFVSLV